MGPKSDHGYTGINETDQLGELLFDCMIECLDSNYSCLCKSGYMTYTKLTFLLTREKLMSEVHREIRGWLELAGKFLDDMVKNEMQNSAGKWLSLFQVPARRRRLGDDNPPSSAHPPRPCHRINATAAPDPTATVDPASRLAAADECSHLPQKEDEITESIARFEKRSRSNASIVHDESIPTVLLVRHTRSETEHHPL
ncbi:hypothetical protein GW17_00044336 [Ensete ventricosum]|nr:hypothetical protein GW17_00044336 [Ensete ventricosum]